MNKLTLDLDELKVDSFAIIKRVRENETAKAPGFAWSDDSVCPTTNPSDRRPCY